MIVLTKYFLKREIQRLIRKSSERPHQYRSMDDIKNILLICDSSDWSVIRGFIEKLKAMQKTVNTAIYALDKKDVPTWYSNYLLLRADRDVNLWGFPEQTLQRQFYHLPADLLIDFSRAVHSPLYYMFLKHPSTFKAGIKYSEEFVYDFSIIPPTDDDHDLPFLFDQLISYLKTINSTNKE